MKKTFAVLGITLVAFGAVYFARIDRLAATPGIEAWNGMDLWQGTWVSEKTKQVGDFKAVFQQDGPNITGNIRIGGSPFTKGGKISGAISGDKLEFGLVKDKKGRLKYSGTVSEDSMSGIWQISILKDRGTWQAVKKPESSPDA